MTAAPLGRRRVLAALAGAAGAGALSGLGTTAVLGDRATLAAPLGVGAVDLAIGYRVWSGPNADRHTETVVNGTHVDLPISRLTADERSGSVLLRFFLPDLGDVVNNPVALWLRTRCPPPTGLSESLFVTLSYADCDTGVPGDRILSGSLRSVANKLRNGTRLDGDPTTDRVDCLTDEVCLLVEYDLADDYVGSETTELALEAGAVQCRNNEPVANPFDPVASCPVGETCDCTYLGKVEFDDDIPVGTYAFTEGERGYEIEVYDNDDDVETSRIAFRVRHATEDVRPDLCRVVVKTANRRATGLDDTATYEPSGAYTNDTASLELTSADGEPVTDGLLTAPGGEKAISYVAVYVCSASLPDGDSHRRDGGWP